MLNKKNGLSAYKQRKVMKAFAVDLTATQTAHLLGFDRKTVNRYYGLFRAAIHATRADKSLHWLALLNAMKATSALSGSVVCQGHASVDAAPESSRYSESSSVAELSSPRSSRT
jgi:hypothetical protein